MRADSIPFGPKDSGLEQVSWGASKTLSAPGMELKQTTQGFNVVVFPQEKAAIEEAMRMIRDGQAGGYDTLAKIAQEIRSSDYKTAIKDIMVNARADQLANDGLTQWIKGMATAGQALSQGAVAAAGEKKPKQESYYLQTRPLSEGQIYMLFDRILIEAGFMDKIKAGAGKVAGAVGKGLDWAGKQATEKVTSAKLLAAWKMEGSPTDSEELRKFLQNYGGIAPEVIDKVYADMKLGSGSADSAKAQTAYAQIKDQLKQLNTKQRKQLAGFLQKQLGTA